MAANISDGDPVDMSQLTLGKPYGSEDMYRDMGVVPGSRVAFEKDGVIYTDTVQSVSYRSGSPAIYRDLNRWQSMARRLTPQRWRKSLLVRPAELASTTVSTGPVDDDVRERFERTQANLAKAGDIVSGLIKSEDG